MLTRILEMATSEAKSADYDNERVWTYGVISGEFVLYTTGLNDVKWSKEFNCYVLRDIDTPWLIVGLAGDYDVEQFFHLEKGNDIACQVRNMSLGDALTAVFFGTDFEVTPTAAACNTKIERLVVVTTTYPDKIEMSIRVVKGGSVYSRYEFSADKTIGRAFVEFVEGMVDLATSR